MTLTADDYRRAFELELKNGDSYPEVDAFERQKGFALDRGALEQAARVLACPVKVNPPNWQHGRVLYAALRWYLRGRVEKAEPVLVLDVGTAKGFSALCMEWALIHSKQAGKVVSLDVIDPYSFQFRNSVLDLDGPRRLAGYLEQWPEAASISFRGIRSVHWLQNGSGRIHFAFLDGKHQYSEVSREIALLSSRQETGDVVVFDDVQIPAIRQVVDERTDYSAQIVEAKPERQYAVAVKK